MVFIGIKIYPKSRADPIPMKIEVNEMGNPISEMGRNVIQLK
jgi:hypothetical protein